MKTTHFPCGDGHVSANGITTAQGNVILRYRGRTEPRLGESREREGSKQKDRTENVQSDRRAEVATEKEILRIPYSRWNHGLDGVYCNGQEILVARPWRSFWIPSAAILGTIVRELATRPHVVRALAQHLALRTRLILAIRLSLIRRTDGGVRFALRPALLLSEGATAERGAAKQQSDGQNADKTTHG